jgi:hypothetical protein
MKYELEYEDVFHLKNLYAGLYNWLEGEGWSSADGGEAEQLYFEIKQPNGGAFHHIWWRFSKDVHKYYRLFLKIDFQTINMQQVEVMWKDKKTKTNKGDLIIRVQLTIQWDPNNLIADHWILKHFENYLRNKLFEKDLKAVKGIAEGDGNDLRDWIKQYLQLTGSQNNQKSFENENKGLGD